MPRYAFTALVTLAALLLFAACGGPVADPGPDPARLAVVVKRTISAQTLQTALRQNEPFSGRANRLDSFLGPFWEIKAEIKQADGTWARLPLAPGQKDLLDGYTLDTRRVFLAPPGQWELRLNLVADVNRTWQEQVGDPYIYRKGPDGTVYRDYAPRWRTQSVNIYLLDQKVNRNVTLQAGQELAIKPFD